MFLPPGGSKINGQWPWAESCGPRSPNTAFLLGRCFPLLHVSVSPLAQMTMTSTTFWELPWLKLLFSCFQRRKQQRAIVSGVGFFPGCWHLPAFSLCLYMADSEPFYAFSDRGTCIPLDQGVHSEGPSNASSWGCSSKHHIQIRASAHSFRGGKGI